MTDSERLDLILRIADSILRVREHPHTRNRVVLIHNLASRYEVTPEERIEIQDLLEADNEKTS